MKHLLPILIINIVFVILSCQPKNANHNETIETLEQFSELQSIIDSDEDKLWVVNFWATTCPPCIKEMPHFKELEEKYRDENLRILLVSLDRAKDLESRVYPFVKKHEISPEVFLLEDQNYSAWTDEVDPSWYGALPATLIIQGEKRNFKFGIYSTYDELQDDVEKVMGDE
ncbi:MAG: hypothetical protein DRI69_09465 [Bacteroidetes bacterium]|nr:MAG: hypothetical protein DRI69_09465 [Bacteroidota bacterium]